ncbi:MAG TPA: hypothetical protein VMM12_03720 [Longimicrobiales bacterium]|nr:hypothetical protein [Longimicrobiales bacterium]
MIGREYFETELPAQIEAAGRPLTVTVVLRDGGSFRVRRLGRVGEGYAIFETYPPAVAGAIRGGRPSGERLTAGPGPHWLVVGFESVSHVALSADRDEAVEEEAG